MTTDRPMFYEPEERIRILEKQVDDLQARAIRLKTIIVMLMIRLGLDPDEWPNDRDMNVMAQLLEAEDAADREKDT